MATMKNRAAWYRGRAEDLRALAEGWDDSCAQAMILEMAQDYERMAETIGNLRVISSEPPGPPLTDQAHEVGLSVHNQRLEGQRER